MTIHAVLFDADGVIQRPLATRRDAWLRVLGREKDLDSFVAEVFEAELPALEGKADFVTALSCIVTEWRCLGTLDDALATWTMIEPDVAVAELVRTLRGVGIKCCLATNQEPFRARYMSERLGYAELFDDEFYSCRMGVAKPALEYFRAILAELRIPASNVLFVDDHQVNADSAREAGIQARLVASGAGADALSQIVRSFGVVSSNSAMEPTART